MIMALTVAQKTVVGRTNKYGVVYDVHPNTARKMMDKGYIQTHTNFYGESHGYKLTASGFEEKRKLAG